MNGTEGSTPDFVSLDLYAAATYHVQLSDGLNYRSRNRLDVKAHVDPATGEVRLFVDKADLANYLSRDR